MLRIARAKDWCKGSGTEGSTSTRQRDRVAEESRGQGTAGSKDRADLAWRIASWRYLTRFQALNYKLSSTSGPQGRSFID